MKITSHTVLHNLSIILNFSCYAGSSNTIVISSVVSVVLIVALAVAAAAIIIFALVFVQIKRKRAALLQQDYYDDTIPQSPIAKSVQDKKDGGRESSIDASYLSISTSNKCEPGDSDSLYATIGDAEAENDVCIRMNENLAYQPSTNFSSYATIGDTEASECIGMGENSAYQPSTNFSLASNSAYVTNAGVANEIELRGRCIDQMKELVKLHESGVLSDAEFERERLYYVNKMQELK